MLETFIPGPAKLGRPPRYEKRAVLNAIFYVVCSGCSWRMLPGELPPWRIVYHYFMRWRQDEHWLLMHDAPMMRAKRCRDESDIRWSIPSGLSSVCSSPRPT